MTSQYDTTATRTPRRRPSPPRPVADQRRASGAVAAAAPLTALGPITYVPDAYDARHAPTAATLSSGQVGIVYPGHRSGRGVWVVLALIVAAVVGFVGWRVMHTGSPTEPGIAYTSAAGHYSVRFPEQPTMLTKTESDGHTKLVIHLAFVPGQGGVLDAQVTGPLTSHVDKLAASFAADMGGENDVTLTGVRRFDFAGAPARQGNFIAPTTGQLMSVLQVEPSRRRFYLVMGLTGPSFDTLKDSFHILP